MVAKIVTTGNQAEGYMVTVYLPAEWIAKFRKFNGQQVMGEPLWSSWRDSPICPDKPYRRTNVYTLGEANTLVAHTREEITRAKKFLSELVQTNDEIEIEL